MLSFRILSTLLIFLGELVAIYAEIRGAHLFSLGSSSFTSAFFLVFPPFLLGAGCLVSGYILGYRAFGNIWIVSVISITSILIVEPVLAYTIFHQLPTRGAAIGLVLGVAGLGSALFL